MVRAYWHRLRGHSTTSGGSPRDEHTRWWCSCGEHWKNRLTSRKIEEDWA